MLAPIYLAVLWRALVDAMYYFLGTCAAGTSSTGCRAVLARRSPERLPERTVRKIAPQEPPSSSGHNNAPPRLPRFYSTGRDAAQGAYLIMPVL